MNRIERRFKREIGKNIESFDAWAEKTPGRTRCRRRPRTGGRGGSRRGNRGVGAGNRGRPCRQAETPVYEVGLLGRGRLPGGALRDPCDCVLPPAGGKLRL